MDKRSIVTEIRVLKLVRVHELHHPLGVFAFVGVDVAFMSRADVRLVGMLFGRHLLRKANVRFKKQEVLRTCLIFFLILCCAGERDPTSRFTQTWRLEVSFTSILPLAARHELQHPFVRSRRGRDASSCNFRTAHPAHGLPSCTPCR